MLIPLLITLAPAAPVPKGADLPRITCAAKRIPIPPGWSDNGRKADDGCWLEVTLTNRTRGPIEIPHRLDMRDRIYSKVADASGKEVSDPLVPDVLILFDERVVEIEPGGTIVTPIHLFRNTVKPGAAPKPGKYTVTVVFESGAIRSAAAPIEVEVK